MGNHCYVAIFQELRKINVCSGVRVSKVDNFQGEENEIIILSLVRSNEKGDVGFVKVDNRVCVSLSRAKQGLFIVGNLDQLCDSSELWQSIRNSLDKMDCVGDSFTLRCQNHPHIIRTITKPEEISYESPEGGCRNVCSSKIPLCGHLCPRICHNDDPNHESVKCKQPCEKKCALGHSCRMLCYQNCPLCTVVIKKKLQCNHEHEVKCGDEKFKCPTMVEKCRPQCQHIVQLKCSEDPAHAPCLSKCDFVLNCGHSCSKICHAGIDPEHKNSVCTYPCERTCDSGHQCPNKCFLKCPPCKVSIEKQLSCGHFNAVQCGDKNFKCSSLVEKERPLCGHIIKVECQQNPNAVKCSDMCDAILNCGHPCPKPCHVDENIHDEIKCLFPCARNCVNDHPCKSLCFQQCPPCTEEIEKTLEDCQHIHKVPCGTVIYECPTLVEKSVPLCKHICTMPCNQNPNRFICDKKCDTRLDCGHMCRRTCHANEDPFHDESECTAPCSRLNANCVLDHKCYQKCLPCSEIMVEKIIPECGHPMEVSCSRNPILLTIVYFIQERNDLYYCFTL